MDEIGVGWTNTDNGEFAHPYSAVSATSLPHGLHLHAVKSLYGVQISEWLLLIGIYPDDSRDQRQSPLIHLCINEFRVL